MKLRSILLLLCTIFSLGTVSIAGTQKSSTLHYKVKLVSKSFGNMGTREMWLKGNMMRWEAISAKLPVRLIKNKNGIFLIHPWNKVAAKYPAGSKRGNPSSLLPGPNGPVKAFLNSVKAVKHGQETVNKQHCNIYTYKDKATLRDCKLWVETKSDKPVQLVLQGVKGKIDTVTLTYTSFEVGKSVSDTLFELPKGYAVRPMPNEKLTSKVTTEKRSNKKAS